MVSLLEYLPIITSGLLLLSILTLVVNRKNLRLQSEYQIYARMIEARLKLETSEPFINMAKESPFFADRFALVDSPDQFYMLRAYIDLYEFIFRLHKTKVIDDQLWTRWMSSAKAMKSIPKFLTVWDKTKSVHSPDFVKFIDSL
ncbi:MAG: hypothetical protein AB7V56_16305 [Candidatus Nitrosocosmicus sp.]|jgi:hypothetical protein|nr:hypothetical protein [Candidatus Nitrosocosmicus sp.]HET6591087.1 hypothetical protein [Candidatus Nitrosocosmicus sp.]